MTSTNKTTVLREMRLKRTVTNKRFKRILFNLKRKNNLDNPNQKERDIRVIEKSDSVIIPGRKMLKEFEKSNLEESVDEIKVQQKKSKKKFASVSNLPQANVFNIENLNMNITVKIEEGATFDAAKFKENLEKEFNRKKFFRQ